MSYTGVKDIRSAALTRIGNLLGSAWSSMQWTGDPKLDPVNLQDKTYSMQSGEGPEGSSNQIQALCVDQKYSIILTRRVPRVGGDTDLMVAVDETIGLMIDVLLDLTKNKMGAPSTAGVMNVFGASYKDPVMYDKELLVVEGELTCTLRIQY